jgi:outer membrane protein, heavy metal efflux system
MGDVVKRSVLLGMLAVLAGCANFQAKPIPLDQPALAFEARTLESLGLKQFLEANLQHKLKLWPPRAWDLALLTLTALYYHPDLDVARAEWGTAEAGIITAGQRPNPALRFSPSFVPNAESGVLPWVLGLNLDIPIETAGKRSYRLEQARHLSEAARLNIGTVAWRVRSRLRTSLLNLYVAERTEAILSRQIAVQEALVKVLEQRLAVGELSQPVVTQAHLALNQQRLSLKEAQKQGAEARVQVAEAIGVAVSALARVPIAFDTLEQPPASQALSTAEVRRQALTNRTDILKGLADYAATQAALQLEIARQYPDLHLGPGYTFEVGEHRWTLFGVSLILPVLHQNQGPIAEAEARRRETAARFNALQAQVIGEIDRTLASTHAALEKFSTAEALLSSQARQLRSAQASFELGQSDRLALLSQQVEYETAQLSRLEALIKAHQSFGQLEDAVQRPLDGSMASLRSLEMSSRPEVRGEGPGDPALRSQERPSHASDQDNPK